ncbi:phosphoribosylamine--glycine ligase [Candidatus Uhrbacteria bacterium]|nr:phosphoribosylamine--glycine ligase [Candidatus Uhrbacteria bacterium]
MNVLIVGSGAREHAIAKALKRSSHGVDLFCVGSSHNPGIVDLATGYHVDSTTDTNVIGQYGRDHKIDWAIIGPEAPLEAGVVDALATAGIPSVGPTKQCAQIETSKSFMRWLLSRHSIPGAAQFKSCSTIEAAREWINELKGECVIKADGLMGGKGVRVSGDHFTTIDEAVAYSQECIARDGRVLIEEKLIGQEFSLMSLCDGKHLAHFPLVQDHKRAFDGDTGSNTGGMGSYSDADFSLPFLTAEDIRQARYINEQTMTAIDQETGTQYKGILYGGFMATADGVKLIEYNARFGDPESLNVLAILESDFVKLCQAVIAGTLSQDQLRMSQKATVCKYAVPKGYPDHPVKNQTIDVSTVKNPERVYYAAVDQKEDGSIVELGSRAIAVVGIGNTISEAEQAAEDEIGRIQGPLFHRKDIGTAALVGQRVAMMRKLRP